MDVIIKNARLSYPHLFTAQEPMPGSPPTAKAKYNARFLLTEEDRVAVDAAIQEVLVDKYPKGVPKAFSGERLCLRLDPEGNQWYINASNIQKPKVVDRRKQELTADSGIPYAGCYVNALIRLWVQDNDYGKRVNANLEMVQFLAHGEPLGRKTKSVDEVFEDLGDEDVPF